MYSIGEILGGALLSFTSFVFCCLFELVMQLFATINELSSKMIHRRNVKSILSVM